MWTGTEVAREIAVMRRAEADEVARGTAVRLARRQRRLTARIQRVEERLSGR
jgi:hypothetical protein